MAFINIRSRQCGCERNSVGKHACHQGDGDGVNKVKEMIIYESHLLMGAITETCNIVVGLAVTGGKTETVCVLFK